MKTLANNRFFFRLKMKLLTLFKLFTSNRFKYVVQSHFKKTKRKKKIMKENKTRVSHMLFPSEVLNRPRLLKNLCHSWLISRNCLVCPRETCYMRNLCSSHQYYQNILSFFSILLSQVGEYGFIERKKFKTYLCR